MDSAKTEWRRWCLLLTLCLFAVAYGVPTSLSAHAATRHTVAAGDCPGAAGRHADAEKTERAGSISACCVAHCLPAMPGPSPAGEIARPSRLIDAASADERGEGRPVPVPRPPPRA